MNDTNGHERQQESQRILKQIAGETAPAGNSYIERGLDRARDHFTAGDAGSNDPIEIWGTRIGRTLGILIVIAMLTWLIFTLTLA
ncbi:MAG: hypothetical protein ACRECW_17730 [Phyllobacterium sp.]